MIYTVYFETSVSAVTLLVIRLFISGPASNKNFSASQQYRLVASPHMIHIIMLSISTHQWEPSCHSPSPLQLLSSDLWVTLTCPTVKSTATLSHQLRWDAKWCVTYRSLTQNCDLKIVAVRSRYATLLRNVTDTACAILLRDMTDTAYALHYWGIWLILHVRYG